jgi:uncharacterized protein YecE (DUF72 family)
MPPPRSRPQLHVGCSGWFYWGWRGKFYPDDGRTDHWFAHYQKHFATVELNAPFYSWPKPATVKSWVRQAKRRSFVYSVKVNATITHDKRMVGTKKLVREFSQIGDVLGRKMGCFLFQFPPSFKYSAANLKRILTQLDPSRRNVIEFRHKSWWREKTYAALRNAGAIFCSVSAPRLPPDVVRTADAIYVRLHGSKRWYRHDYSKDELRDWATRILASGAKQIWVYFDNDRDAHSVRNAKSMLRILRQMLRDRQPIAVAPRPDAPPRADKKETPDGRPGLVSNNKSSVARLTPPPGSVQSAADPRRSPSPRAAARSSAR